jgi:hypothetical protein
MVRQLRKMKFWPSGARASRGVLADGRAGDRLSGRGSEEAWRGLRHHLAARGLVVVSVGQRLFLAPAEVESRVPLLQQLATAAVTDAGAAAALQDLVLELFGPVPGLAEQIAEAGQRAVEQAEREEPDDDDDDDADDSPLPRTALPAHCSVPGGPLAGNPQARKRPPPATIDLHREREAARRVAKLGKLQRSVLTFARDYAIGGYRGLAPLASWPGTTRSDAATLSRAVRGLEARGLIEVTRNRRGWATHISLSWAGREVIHKSAGDD